MIRSWLNKIVHYIHKSYLEIFIIILKSYCNFEINMKSRNLKISKSGDFYHFLLGYGPPWKTNCVRNETNKKNQANII